MRLLIALEDERRAHREMLGLVIKVLRSQLDVTVCGLAEFEGELERLEPQMVICGQFRSAEPSDNTLAWVELSLDPLDPTKSAKIRVGESRWDIHNPGLQDLLSVIDKAEQLARSGEDPWES